MSEQETKLHQYTASIEREAAIEAANAADVADAAEGVAAALNDLPFDADAELADF